MKFETIICEVSKTTNDMWNKGWTEANGGNISIRLERSILEQLPTNGFCREYDLPNPCPVLGGEVFFATGTGMHLRNFELNPALNGGIIQISPDGKTYKILWGFEREGKPTSELPTLLFTHNEFAADDPDEPRVVVHCHTPNLIAMSYAMDLDSDTLSKILWVMHTECLVVFPSGVSYLPWIVPGTNELGIASAKLLKERPVLLWQYHGLLAVGNTLDQALGRIHVAEKTAEVFMKAQACTNKIVHISDDQLKVLSDHFECNYDKVIMQTCAGI